MRKTKHSYDLSLALHATNMFVVKKTFAEIIVALLRRKNTKQSQLCAVCPNYRGIERQSRNTIPTKGKRQNFLFWETTIDWGTAHSRPTTPNSDRFAYLRLLRHGIAFI